MNLALVPIFLGGIPKMLKHKSPLRIDYYGLSQATVLIKRKSSRAAYIIAARLDAMLEIAML